MANTERYMDEEKMPLKTLISSLIFRAFSMLNICAPKPQQVLSSLSNTSHAQIINERMMNAYFVGHDQGALWG